VPSGRHDRAFTEQVPFHHVQYPAKHHLARRQTPGQTGQKQRPQDRGQQQFRPHTSGQRTARPQQHAAPQLTALLHASTSSNQTTSHRPSGEMNFEHWTASLSNVFPWWKATQPKHMPSKTWQCHKCQKMATFSHVAVYLSKPC